MPKMRKKADLPSKPCVVCGRPFVWRKKWEKVWSEVLLGCLPDAKKRLQPSMTANPPEGTMIAPSLP